MFSWIVDLHQADAISLEVTCKWGFWESGTSSTRATYKVCACCFSHPSHVLVIGQTLQHRQKPRSFAAILKKSKCYLHNCVIVWESDYHWQSLHELSKETCHDGNLCCSKEIKISPLVDLRKNNLIQLLMLNGIFNNFGAFVYRR